MLPLNTLYVPRWIFIQSGSLLKAETCWQGTTLSLISSLQDRPLVSGAALSDPDSLDFRASTFPEICFTMEKSWCFPWGIIFKQTSNFPTKRLTSQLVGLTLTLLHIRAIEKGVFRAQIWDLHPTTLQRVCGFTGLQHRLCSITSIATNPSLGVFACANLGFAALSLWRLQISDFQWVLHADGSPHTLGIILWVLWFP